MAPVIPAITAIGGLVGTGISLMQAFKKPPQASMPQAASPLVAEKNTSKTPASLINTSPAGVLDDANTTRAKLLGN